MVDIKFRGPETGPVTIIKDGLTFNVSHIEPVEPDADAMTFGSTRFGGANNTGLSYTTEGCVAPFNFSQALVPATWRGETRCQIGSSGDVIATNMTDDPLTGDFFVGATAEVYRIVNGVWTHIRSSVIDAANIRERLRLIYVAAGQTEAKYKHPSFSRRDHNWEYGIAAIDLTAGTFGNESWTTYYRDSSEPHTENDYVALDAVNLENLVSGGALPAPTNFTAVPDAVVGNGLTHFTWDGVTGADGYIIFATNSAGGTTFPTTRTFTLQNDGSPGVQEGDHVIIKTRVMEPNVDTMMSFRTRNASSEGVQLQSWFRIDIDSEDFTYQWRDFDDNTDPRPHITRVPYSYLRATHGPLSNNTVVLDRFALGSSGEQDNYWKFRAGDQFTTAFYVRSSTGCTLRMSNDVHSFTYSGNDVVIPPDTWTWVEITGTADNDAPNTYANIGKIYLQVLGGVSGGTIDFAGAFIRIVGLNLGVLPAAQAAIVRPNQRLRDHAAIKPGYRTMDMNDWSSLPGFSCRNTNIETLCRQCDNSGGQPWFQIEWHHTVDDWLDILAYIAAPVSSGHYMALRRQANGRTEPWIDAFETITWEVSNESWNELPEFWTAPSNMIDSVTSENYSKAQVFGMICRHIAQAMQASPYWNNDKMQWFLGGWSGREDWNNGVLEKFWFSGVAQTEIGIANYMGGWDEGDAIVDIWATSSMRSITGATPLLKQDQMDNLVATAQGAEIYGWTFGVDLLPAVYEAGPGYQLNGLNGAIITSGQAVRQNKAYATRLASTGYIDLHLSCAARGLVDNIFQLRGSTEWSTHQKVLPNETAKPLAFVDFLTTLYDEMGGDFFVYNPPSLKQPIITLKNTNGVDEDTNQSFAYVLQSKSFPDRWAFVMGNRSLDTAVETLVLNVVKPSANSMRVLANRGDMFQHNRYVPGFQQRANSVVSTPAVATSNNVIMEDLSHMIEVGQVFRLNGVDYNVTSVTQSPKSTNATVTFNPPLDSDANVGDSVRWEGVDAGNGMLPDADCVEIVYTVTDETVPDNIQQISAKSSGGTVSALNPGECVVVILE